MCSSDLEALLARAAAGPGRFLREAGLAERLAEALCRHVGLDPSRPMHDLSRERRRALLKDPRRKPVVRFLNLFAYTGAASVHAAAAGAETTTVDLSNTYLDWARENFTRNGLLAPTHSFVQADCLQWVAEQSATARAARAAGRSEIGRAHV